MNKKIAFRLVAFVSIALFGLLFYGLKYASNPREVPSAQLGQKAYDFKTITFKGESIELKQFRGKPVVLNFWASWCVTCWQEAHLLESTHQAYTPRGAVFIGIAINDEREASLRFIRKYNKSYYLAPDSKIGNIALDYGVTAVPETFLINKEGYIEKKILGVIKRGELAAFLNQQLNLN